MCMRSLALGVWKSTLLYLLGLLDRQDEGDQDQQPAAHVEHRG